MLKIFKKDKNQTKIPLENEIIEQVPVVTVQTNSPVKQSLFGRLKQSLAKTRRNFGQGISTIFLGKKEIDADLLEQIETLLLSADLGIHTTQTIIKQLTDTISRDAIKDPARLLSLLKKLLIDILSPMAKPLVIAAEQKPFVILVVGINGSGKTTTIGKLAKYLQHDGKKVMLAAGDTFRAAAIEQLEVWGIRHQIPVISQQAGADTASVIFDALQSATAKSIDVLIADTAGRLHTQDHLMEELKKVKRVMGKISSTAPHEILLVLDAGIGQNALVQAKKFTEALNITGLVLTKLDGTAKGGIIFAIADTLKIPIRYIGIGEGSDDLKPFDPTLFVEALFANEHDTDE
jgi:fused signal recognition particle receptor